MRTGFTKSTFGRIAHGERMVNLAKHLAVIIMASFLLSFLLGYVFAQGEGGSVASAIATWSEFLSMSTPLAAIILLSVEVVKRRAPELVNGLRGTALALGIGFGWGLIFNYAPSFAMYDSLMDSLVYGAVAAIIASGFYDVVVHPAQDALKTLDKPRVVRMETVAPPGPALGAGQDEPLSQSEQHAAFVASVATRDQMRDNRLGGRA